MLRYEESVMKTLCQKNYPYIIIALFAIGLFIRAKFSFCWSDEAYYIAGVNRILEGDRFLTDEWYVSQVFSIILFPIVALYKKFIPSYDGCYLFMRYFYVVCQTAMVLYFYKTTKKNKTDKIASLFASLVLLFYCRAYICTFSYYSAILIFVVLGLCLLFDLPQNAWKVFGAGLCFAGVIIINPYCSVLLILCLIIFLLYKKRKSFILYKYKWSFLLGLLLVFGFAGTLVLKNNSFAEIFASMNWWTEGEVYAFDMFRGGRAFLYVAGQFRYTIIVSAISVFYSIYLIVQNKMTSKRENILGFLGFLCFFVNCIIGSNLDGYMHANFSILGLQIFLLNKNKNWSIFNYFYVPGLVLAYFMNLSSDTQFSAMGIGFAISAAASCFFMYDYIRPAVNKGKKMYYMFGLTSMILVVLISGVCRFLVVYRDSALSNLKYRIENGPAKGLLTTEEHLEQYKEVMSVMDEYCSREGNVLILSSCPWAYLCTDMHCAGYTTWRITMEETENKLQAYYIQHPDKIPDVVIELRDDIGKIDRLKFWKDLEFMSINPQYDSRRHNSFLWKYMKDNNYKKIAEECGNVWIK